MSKIKKHYGPTNFTVGELADIGRRLTSDKLKEMNLFDAVLEAEKENIWRLKSSIELLKPLTHILPEILLFELERAELQLENPTRGEAKEESGVPRPEGRTLPKPGTILVRSHDYVFYNWKKVKNADGSESFKYNDVFRFLVVEQPCKMLRLDEAGGPIYTSRVRRGK